MKKRTAIAAIAGSVLLGAGAFGIATAQTPEPTGPGTQPPSTTQQDPGSGQDQESMIRHCTDALPSGDRDQARATMQDMMRTGGMMSAPMTGGQMMPGPMMGGTSAESGHHGMTGAAAMSPVRSTVTPCRG
ncbi:hypothetical protein [Nocardia salmonicida]|uniref:hypothetical protein n=1 Tax=Nocardia salmonicida TaxID=53431 RepID=UPI0007A40D51|nr:hypothetical protein [Nocardia salmonicida]